MKKISRVVSEIRCGRVLMLGIALFLGLTVQASAATKVAKPLPSGVQDAGVLPASTSVQATLYLQPDAVRVAALTTFLTDVQTPGSASYRQWVTPDSFAKKFGATEAQVERLRNFVRRHGLAVVSVSGLRMVISGSTEQVEAAFAPGLHQVMLGGKAFVAATNVVTVPRAVSGDIASIGGMETVPESVTALRLVADGVAVAPGSFGSLEDLASTVEANAKRVLTVGSTACATDFAETDRAAMQNLLREAAAQGMTVLAESGCGTAGDVSFPAALPEVVSVAPVTGVSGDTGFLPAQARPLWQNAPGLPADALRHEPDVAASSLSDMAATCASILAQMDVVASKTASGAAPARLGNVAATLYALAPVKGLYTQPDAIATGKTGNWESVDGLGLVDLDKLKRFYPNGTLSTYITVTTTPSFATHGATITFFAEVKDISGQGTSAPTGTITFATDTGVALGSAQLIKDSIGANASVTSNVLAAGGYNVVATYSGDSLYGTNSNQTYFTVGPEEGTLSGTVAGTVNLGGTIVVTITDKSTSGVGTPSVTGYVIPQGVSNPTTYTVKLTGTGGTATGTVSVPATLAGSQTLLVGCTSTDPSFTCYNSVNITATVNKATPTVTFTVAPSAVVANQPTVFTLTVKGATGQVAPTGSVIFYDNGVNIGQGGVDPSTGKAVFTANNLSATATHGFSATYYGDNNYASVNASPNTSSGTSASVTTMSVTPNPPVSGQSTTLQATITSGVSGVTSTPTGTVTFYQDGVALFPTVPVNTSGVATYQFTLSSSTAHTFYAIYSGDTTYQSSQSSNVATPQSGTVASTTSLTVSPNPPVAGSTTTLTATVASAATSSTTVPTGTVTFYQDGTALSGAATLSGSGVATYTSTTLSSTTAHTFYAVYSGNSIYQASTSPSVPTTAATSGSTSTTLTVTPNPPVSGSLTTLAATIAYAVNGTTLPTGTVTFYQDGIALTPAATVTGGTTAVFTSTALSGTTAHTFTAKYSGDSNYVSSTSPAVSTSTSTGVATTTTLTVTPNPPVNGSLTTLKAAVTTTGTGTPTGNVVFYQDGAALSPAAVLTSGVATYTSTTLSSTMAHSYLAAYAGDTTFATSTSTAVSTPAAAQGTVASTTTLTASPTTATAGGTVTLNATVASAAAGTTTVPTGSVTFTSSTQGLLGTAALNSAGVATLPAILSVAGAGTITATYAGDSVYAASTSALAFTVTGTTVTPTITLTINPTIVSYGGNVTFSTTITAVPTTGTTGPAGSVTWTVTSNATGVATSYTQALTTTSTTTAAASATIVAPAVGNYTVTATCVGTNFSCSGLTISKGLAVTKVSTIVTLTANPNPPASGAPVVLTAYIASSAGPISASCGGTVTFYVNGVSAGSNGVTGNQAQLVVTLPLATGNVLYAVYNGDSNCSASVSSTLLLSTPPAGTTSVLTTTTNTALYTANVVLTMVVSSTPTATNPTPGYPTGSVTFYDTFNGVQTPIGSASLAQNGPYSSLVTFQTTGLQAGTHTILGVYAGVKAYSPSNADVITVNITDFSTQFSPSSSTATKGQTVTVLTTVAPINGFAGQVVLGCVPPSGSATTCTFSPNVLTTGSGIVTLTITTTKATTGMLRWQQAAGTSLALAMLGLFWPGGKRRKLRLAAAILLSVGLIGSTGCTTVQGLSTTTQSGSGSGSAGSSSSGTPSGTLQFAITASGTDGKTVNRHDLKYSVTVQ